MVQFSLRQKSNMVYLMKVFQIIHIFSSYDKSSFSSNDFPIFFFLDIKIQFTMTKNILDLNVRIIERKCSRRCTKHAMSNYLSDDKLSHNHWAYLFRIYNFSRQNYLLRIRWSKLEISTEIRDGCFEEK